jgi:uncharacterized protein (DUF2147 family)
MNHKKNKSVTIPLVATIALALLCFGRTASADKLSPVGTWKTIDDKTKKAKSHVKIWEHKGTLYGKIEILIKPDEPNPLCDKCPGKRHNKPVVGMIFLWDLKKDGGSEWWDDGRILDPDNGKIYRCKLKVTNGGKNLDVRGYLGIALLGRTQTWHRVK